MKITIIGCGNMGKALASRLKGHTLFLYDINIEKMEALAEYGHVCSDYKDALKLSDLIILAVKPQGFDEAAKLFEGIQIEGKILISLLAGVKISDIRKKIPLQRIIRMMPNLPLIYGEGLIGLSSDTPLSRLEDDQLLKICEPLGKAYFLDEAKMNAFTSIAGSGPAFVLKMIESMIDAALQLEFQQEEAEFLVRQMVKGSCQLLEKSGKQADELIKQIASPQGTTVAGLDKFEELQVDRGIIDTFLAAYERANELTGNNPRS